MPRAFLVKSKRSGLKVEPKDSPGETITNTGECGFAVKCELSCLTSVTFCIRKLV